MSTMLLRIDAEYYNEDCSDCGCGSFSGFSHRTTSLGELLKETNDYELQQLGLVRIQALEKKVTPHAQSVLKLYGWAHAASAEDREQRKVLEQKFYILNENGHPYSYHDPKFAELNLDDVHDELLKRLAEGAQIVQKVSAKSVLSEKDYKRYLTIKKNKEDAAKKSAENKKAKLAAKKQKEIEKAKKLLEEAGELKEEKQ